MILSGRRRRRGELISFAPSPHGGTSLCEPFRNRCDHIGTIHSIYLGETRSVPGFKLDRNLILDLSLIGLDVCTGLSLALWLLPRRTALASSRSARWRACYPMRCSSRIASIRINRSKSARFHSWVHAKRQLAWRTGVVSQALFAITVACITLGLH